MERPIHEKAAWDKSHKIHPCSQEDLGSNPNSLISLFYELEKFTYLFEPQFSHKNLRVVTQIG